MFEAAELGRKVDKDEYAKLEPALKMRLLEAQRALRAAKVPMVIIVSGVEGAGKWDPLESTCRHASLSIL